LTNVIRSKHVLVVDDDQGTRNLFRLVLVPMGYQVTLAANGQEALAEMRRGPFDLIITDLHLPDSNGLILAEHGRALYPKANIVMATIDDDADTILRAFAAGCNVYLIKPYQLDHVVELVRRLETATGPVRLLSDRLGMHDYNLG
jgi:CheY-like chemotaxis protein